MLTVFRGGWVVTQNAERDIFEGDVAVDGEKIIYAGPEFKGSADRTIDVSGDIVMPGLINTHTHVAMSVMKGSLDDLLFPDFLNASFKVDADRTDADIELGTKLGCMEMIRGGTTTFMDLYYSEDVIAKAVSQTGIRGVLCWCVLDEDKTTQTGNPLKNCAGFCASHKNMRKIIPGVGLQGVYVCSEETCIGAKELSDRENLPMNFHLSETRGEVNAHRKATGKRPAEWLYDIGVLGPRGVAAHSAWLTLNEIRLMGESGLSVSSCPVSNMKLATGGVAPVPEFETSGVNVSVGTDGSTTNNSLDMFAEMKTLGLLQKAGRWDATVAGAQSLLDYVTVNGAKAVGMADRIGSLEPGKYADIIVLDGKAPNLRPLVRENIVGNLAYSASGHNVKHTMCQGDLVMEDREIVSFDTESVLDGAEDVWRQLCLR
ncbi:MAG: amidohydrolase family protein [Candidatus Methanomethylophilaceae archaeon]|jgi:5-methylthioadenosine/S-adenosylhomocysteine deaminase